MFMNLWSLLKFGLVMQSVYWAATLDEVDGITAMKSCDTYPKVVDVADTYRRWPREDEEETLGFFCRLRRTQSM
jgi:hypothetical protein